MTTFVKLTRPDGKATWICPDQICAVDISVPSTTIEPMLTSITLVNTTRFVVEDIHTVIELLSNLDDKA